MLIIIMKAMRIAYLLVSINLMKNIQDYVDYTNQ